ncbi:anaphase-promoting complex subunit Cut9 [Malassezia cuniculi]|uniref:Anaphase-promoting complex subunit Cut9 n=1 Tax=Malassezia cuniculi TaxID=948313 RepID=A0AAF0J4N2_9BASI|nr:anaphase-promoting complex subunit Cut9 [Malassezia cuniculi]
MADGSLSVMRAEEEASNSGLLDLNPVLESPSRQDRIFTPTPETRGGPSFAPPPLLGKAHARRTVLDSPFANRNVSNSSDVVSDSNNSVIINPAEAPAMFEIKEPIVEAPSIKEPEHTKLAARLRRWMHDAMKQHLYETAIFWGRQILMLETTNMAFNDAYWLAQAYFFTHQYARAEQLLTTPLRYGANVDTTVWEPTPASTSDALHDALEATRANTILPQSILEKRAHTDRFGPDELRTVDEEDDEHVDELLGNDAETPVRLTSRRRKRSPSPGTSRVEPTGSLDPFSGSWGGPSFLPPSNEVQMLRHASERAPLEGPCLVNWSSPCRYLAAQCQARLGKLYEALDLIGEDHTRWTGGTGAASCKVPALDGGLKLGSSVCHLRGQIYLRLDEVAKAREAFMLALALDVKNYDSFSALIDGNLLSADEQWSFVQTLEFAAQAGEADAQQDFELVRLMYTTRLAKQTAANAQRSAQARKSLCSSIPALRQSPDVLLSLAEELYARLRYEDAYEVTLRIAEIDSGYSLALPIRVGCMYYLTNLHPALFLLAHQLTEADPASCEAWYAVGVWYASVGRWTEARRYFSKSSLLDPRFAPSWIAFGHSFALEGESEQAITAYSTASRKFQFSGLPRLFIGMEYLHQGNRNLATLFLDSSTAELGNDPLCANERGVVAFQNGETDRAIALFTAAVRAAEETQQPLSAWVSVHLNLGLALRRAGRDAEARVSLLRVIEQDTGCAPAYIALGMCAHRAGDLVEAIGWYHEGLSIDPRDPVSTELLALALDQRVAQGMSIDDIDLEAELTGKSADAAGAAGTAPAGVVESAVEQVLYEEHGDDTFDGDLDDDAAEIEDSLTSDKVFANGRHHLPAASFSRGYDGTLGMSMDDEGSTMDESGFS